MMFSDEEIKETPENGFMRPGDEIISIREVCLADKFDKKNSRSSREPVFINTDRDDLDITRSMFRDVFPDNLEMQARFAWTEEDGNIAALVSDAGFGSTSQSTFTDLDEASKTDPREADTSSVVFESTSRNGLTFCTKTGMESQVVSSTSNGEERPKGPCKVDKTDPRSRLHFVKYVKRHGRTVKLWECGICSREFQHQYTLMRHLPTHTDERNFHCEACGKSFRQLSTLSQHRAIHSSERPYACEVCSKTFNRVSTLISHRKTHSEQKPYKCSFCPKGFHQKGNLRNHLFTHTNERPYRCSICFKGFNQQSNLVCHKNKAHPEEDIMLVAQKRSQPRAARNAKENHPEISRASQNCEVSSSIGPYLPAIEKLSTSSCSKSWDLNKPFKEEDSDWSSDNTLSVMGSGVIVDPIKTYHMGVALATQQTPFALLKPNNSAPVLVKVIDTQLPGGKQMLVPATAEDLKEGGKIVLKSDNTATRKAVVPEAATDLDAAVQIRVPVVAIVVPKIKTGGRLHLTVEEPHHAYHTALSSDVGEVKVEPCQRSAASRILEPTSDFEDGALKNGDRIPPSCTLPPPAPSPTLDLISMELFEPMECIPMGPQITAVDNMDQPPPSDDSDIFIGEFNESIPLSDSD